MAKKRDTPQIVEAEGFVLRDQQGVVRASLVLLGGGVPSLQLNGPDGIARISMQVEPGGRANLTLSMRNGESLVGMSADEEQGNVGIRVANRDGSTAFEVGYFFGQPPHLHVCDATGKVLWASPPPGG